MKTAKHNYKLHCIGIKFGCFVSLFVLIISQYGSSVAALSQAQQDVLNKSIYYYDVAACASTPTDTSAPTNNPDGTIDITSIVNKYNLQSAMILKVGDQNPLASYKINEPPVTPASTMKLIIADVALQSGLDLDKTVSVGSDVYYDGGNDLNKNPVTLRYALIQMLSQSSNVGANVLMKAMGGVSNFTQKAHNYNYSNTDVGGYYDPSNDGKNSSTIDDEVNAMNHIFSTNGGDYETAQNALKEASQGEGNHYGVDDIANKWAGTTQVAGNVGLFDIGANQYIIGLYYNGSIGTESGNTIQKASSDLKNAIDPTLGAGPSSSSDTCCPPASGGDITSLSGKDTIEQTINFFLQEGLSLQQAAGVAANFAWETGGGTNIDPLIAGPDPNNANPPGAWGIAEWTPPTHYTDDKSKIGVTGSDADLLTQLEVVWGQIQGKGNVYSNNILPGLQATKTAADAANYFRENFEVCDTSYSSCLIDRPKTAEEFFNKYNGGSLTAGGGSFVSGGADACSAAGAAQTGTVAAAVAAAKLLSSYKIPYQWGGLHGSGELDITDPSKLKAHGADCSGSVSWVLHQAGMLGSTGLASVPLESWGQAGKGDQMTVWANTAHAFLEFNVPGLGHYQLNTVNAEGAGAGPRFFQVDNNGSPGSSTSGFTPRHWPGT